MILFINEYIGFSTDSIPSNEILQKDLNKMIEILHIANHLFDCSVNYNSVGLTELFSHLEDVNYVYEYGLHDPINQLRIMISQIDNSFDWSTSKLHRDDHNYLALISGGLYGVLINKSSLAEAAEYLFLQKKPILVLNFTSSVYNTFDVINITRTNIQPPGNVNLINLHSKNNKEDFVPHYFLEREAVSYNHNDKHGENHTVVKTIDNVKISPLECSISTAEELLKFAIAENIKSKDLIAYDEDNSKFIRFKCENPSEATGRKYHGFHPHDNKIDETTSSFILENLDLFSASKHSKQ